MDTCKPEAHGMGTVGESTVGKGLLMDNITLQSKHCDMSRGTNKAPKILKNIGEVARHFPIDEPILCVGCGDGLEIEAFKLLGFKDVTGIELDPEKVTIAREHGCDVALCSAEDYHYLDNTNIYCAHTLEHCKDKEDILGQFSHACLSTVCVIVPIEPKGTKNPSHLSAIHSLMELNIDNLKVVRMYENWNYEYQGIIVWKRM